jgi:hypothetical protein
MEPESHADKSEETGGLKLHTIGILVFALLLLVALAAYRPILNNTLLGDDFAEIKRLYQIPATELWRLFSVDVPSFVRPVPYFMYWFQYRFFGLDALPSHLINVGLHAGSAFLLFWFLARSNIHRLAAFMAAALFVLTPLAPETVTWSDGRYDAAVLFFIVLTLCLYLVALQSHSRLAYAGALLAAVSAFLSKESAVILLALLPVMELLYRIFPPAETCPDPGISTAYPARGSEDSAGGHLTGGMNFRTRILKSILRLAPFFVAIGFFFVLRLLLLGGLGGYKQVRQFGVPNLGAPARTILAMLAPLDEQLTPHSTILVMAAVVGLLYLTGAALVVIRWKRGSGAARRMIILLAVVFVSSLLPVYSAFFLEGMGTYLVNSRFFYVPDLAFITLMVVALYEFGWQTRNWRIAVTVPLAILLPVYFWGLNHNNHIWEKAASISYNITTEIPAQLPDPPQNAIIYIQNAPMAEGAHFFANGLPETVTMIYNREDIKAYYVDPEPGFRVNYASVYGGPPADGYLFFFDRDTGHMKLVRGPITP